jgi:hypothetical protein
MSEDDGFIREVTEDVQRERIIGFFRKYGTVIAGCVAVIILGVSSYTYWSYTHTKKAQEFGAALLAAKEVEDETERTEAYESLTKEYAGETRAVFAHLNTGTSDLDASTGDVLYDDAIVLARLYQNIDSIEVQTGIDTLLPLTEEGRPFRLAALELLASLHIRNNAFDSARELYEIIATNASTPPGMRSRASYMMAIYPKTSEVLNAEDNQE